MLQLTKERLAMRHAGAPGGTAWTQPDLMDCLQLFVAVSLWWTLRLSPSLPLSVMTWGPEFLSPLWPHSCTSLLVGFRGSTELTIFQPRRTSESGTWVPACWLNPLKAHAANLILHNACCSIIGPPGIRNSEVLQLTGGDAWQEKTRPGSCPSTSFRFNFTQMPAYPSLILSKPICFKRLNPSLELLLFSFSRDSHA